MKILVIGSGGREHALIWKLSQSPKVKKIFCAPGNGGLSDLAENVTFSVEDVSGLASFAKKENIDLTIVGPELPLSLGIVDKFEEENLKIFGPTKKAAIIEASKCFTKEICKKYNIPTADFQIAHTATQAREFIENRKDFPVVIKADGLAQGKGVIIAKNKEEAFKAIEDIMVKERFGDAGEKLVIEDFMAGDEATFMVATDGENFVAFESAQDHKRIGDNDTGPNTGGMGAYSPAPLVTDKIKQKVENEIIKPLLKAMKEEGRLYKGILYAGLMIKDDKPRVVEFNCRFGDPECQAILFRLKTDLIDVIQSSLDGKLSSQKVEFDPQTSVCVVMSQQGYPGSYENGKIISGLKEASNLDQTYVFHAGTKREGKTILTNGGRVLGVTAKADGLKMAIDKVYKAVSKITWDGAYYRKDIGRKGIS